MAHRTMIGGTAYELSGGKLLVGGTAYPIRKGRTLAGGTGYDIGFGTPAGELAVGSSVYVKEDGVDTEFMVVQQGIPDAALYDGSCDGTWLLRKDLEATKRQWHNANTNAFADSDMFAYLNRDYLAKLDSGIQSAIRDVTIPYCLNGTVGTLHTGADGLQAKVFLPSAMELGYKNFDGYYTTPATPDEGVPLAYFQSVTTIKDPRVIAYLEGAAAEWWTRSPKLGSGGQVITVYATGYAGMPGRNASLTYGVRPLFVVASDYVFSDGALITA